MKILVKSVFLIQVLVRSNLISAQTPITLTTPHGTDFNAYQVPELFDEQDKIDKSNEVALYYPQATEINPHSATTTYNCHSYAWNKTEGGPTCWIGQYSQNEEDIYWTDQSYIETDEAHASKISYYQDDHSAIQTSTQGTYKSKWGNLPLMQHARNYGPALYQMSYRRYYRLNFVFTGSITLLCAGQQRTFTSNSVIQGATYSWTKDNNRLNLVGGAGTYQYTIQAKSNVNDTAWVDLQITTPSGEIANAPAKKFWVGVPEIKKKKVDGNDYYSGMQICAGSHWLSVTPYGDGAGNTAWTVPAGITYFVGTNTLDFTFPYGRGSVSITSRSTNSCGTSSNTAFYLIEKTFGCFLQNLMTIAPNPASHFITITIAKNDLLHSELDSLPEQENLDKNNPDDLTVYTIRIYNNQSTLLLTTTRTGSNFSIPVDNLNSGTYIIEVNDQKNVYRQQFLIKHD